MKCSVCIPTYKRPTSIMVTLSRLLGEVSHIEEILIGVTGWPTGSLEFEGILNQLLYAFKMAGVEVKIHVGFRGLMSAKAWFKEEAKSEILLLLDDDAILGEGYFDLLGDFGWLDVGAVSGILQTPINVGGYADWSESPIEVDGEESNKIVFDEDRKTLVWKDKWQVYRHTNQKLFNCEYLIGTALFVSKKDWEIDLAFESGACGGEEIDFTYAMFRKGLKLLCNSGRVAWHLHVETGGTREFSRKDDQKNFDYFVKKWGLGSGVADNCSVYQEKSNA